MRPYYVKGSLGMSDEQYTKASNEQGFREDLSAAVARSLISQEEADHLLSSYHRDGMDSADKALLELLASRGYKC